MTEITEIRGEPTSSKPEPVNDPAGPGEASLFHLYARWFDVVPADTPERLADAYRLRYQVYCLENTYENAAEHSDGMETDRYDRHSVHSLLIHRSTGMVAGAVRLVLPDGSGSIDALPVSQVCTDPVLRDPHEFPPARTAEISRFAVSKAFRRRITDVDHVDMHFLDEGAIDRARERRILAPNITLGLLKAIAEMSIRNGITHLSAVMEPALLRLLARLGVRFVPLGQLVEYHGRRQPCFAKVALLGVAMMERRPDAHELVTDQGRYLQQARDILSAE